MKRIFYIYRYIVLLAISLNAEITTFGSIGYSENYSPTVKDNFSLSLGVGYKYKDSKLYLSTNPMFYTKNSKEVSLLINSINYDHIYYRQSDFMFYGGIGACMLVVVDTLDNNTDVEESFELNKIAGGSANAGFLYGVSENFNLDFGVKYLYMNPNINQELVRNTYGAYLNFEYDFFTIVY